MLNIARLVTSTINMTPTAVPRRGFGKLLVVGDSTVIDQGERTRDYTTLEGVAADFGTSAPEYLAAQVYFGQTPRPRDISIGRWARTAAAGQLRSGVHASSAQAALLATLQAITNGSMEVAIDGGAATELTLLNFTGAANLSAVAAIIDAALAGATVTWDGVNGRFRIVSGTTGVSSTVGYAAAQGTGTDISATLKLTLATGASLVAGIAAETALQAITALAANGTWYFVTFAAATQPDDDAMVAVAGYIEAATPVRFFIQADTDTDELDTGATTNLAQRLKALLYRRACALFSPNKAAGASWAGRMATVNFNANRSTITMKFKVLPGIAAEDLTETQANFLAANRCNVFAQYDNGASITQEGVMAGPAFCDEIHGLDWFNDGVVAALFNLLYTSATKIPQTDAGMNQLKAAIVGVCQQAVTNGLVAPGVWTAEGFGELQTGQTLDEGFYVYAPPISSQSQEDREARKAPPIQIGLKLAGAFHSVEAIINVNR